MRRALEEPLRRIAENAGLDGAVVVGRVEEMKGTKGFNAATGEYEDLAAAGIIDPTKVVRTALQNAASIAGLLLTTDAAVTDAPRTEEGRPAKAGAVRTTTTKLRAPTRLRQRRTDSLAFCELASPDGRIFAVRGCGRYLIALKRNGEYARRHPTARR